MDSLYAHSKADVAPGPGWHELARHLRAVAELAAGFASLWGAREWGHAAGLWHDLGKAAPDWQAFLRETGPEAHVLGEEQPRPAVTTRRRGPDHSSAGAIHAGKQFGRGGLPIQFAIAGHHAGLADCGDLDGRLSDKLPRYTETLKGVSPDELGPVLAPAFPHFVTAANRPELQRRRLEMFTRLLFSALVDADCLDTERFFDAGGGTALRGVWPALARYLPVLEAHVEHLESTAAPTSVNRRRHQVLEWCRAAAERPPGTYTLTVPTGGGKTLSSLVFALRHAQRHGFHRVVVALPFISVLDQTASIFREVFEPALGPDVLVEHHSAIEPVHDTAANRLASENWDAPLVVTTQVQLFESLFANRPSACRKLHSLANSVLVLDEVQTLPASLLAPIIDVLQDLHANYGVSVLLTTATQPSLHTRELGPWRFEGLDPKPTEIVPAESITELFDAFRRVAVHWPQDHAPLSWISLAERLVPHPQVLAIVHRRRDAADLWQALADSAGDDVLHLSALMCPAHRRRVLGLIRQRLAFGEVCRVVSTQLVEAGVDVDFPVVYRAMAGLEALAQSAGRCNREGRHQVGRFEVFHPPTEPPGVLRLHRDEAMLMLDEDPALDLMAPATFGKYFDRVYGRRATDARGIQALRSDLRFEETAARFRMIDSAVEPVFVPYGPKGRRAIDVLRHAGPSRERFRALQPYGVTVYPGDLRDLVASGAVELLHETVYVLVAGSMYDARLGLKVAPEPVDAWIA